MPLLQTDCVLLAAPSPPPPGFTVQMPPRPCLVPKYQPTSAASGDSAAMPMSVPPAEKPEPSTAPPPEQSGLLPLLSPNTGLQRNDLTLPMLNLVGMTVLPRSFGKYVSLERDWRTSQGLVRLHADVGRLHPFVEGSFLVVDGRVVNIFLVDPNPNAVFREDRRLAELMSLGATKTPYWFAGVTIDLGKGFALGIGGTALPLADRTFSAGALILTIPLGPKR